MMLLSAPRASARALLPLALLAAGCPSKDDNPPKPATATAASSSEKPPAPPTARAATAGELAFRDAAKEAPPGWKGPRFKLSHDYPAAAPTCNAPWLKRKVSFTDPKQKWNDAWKGYVQDIIDYVREGQDPDLPDDVGWRAAVGGQPRWFHVPWMAYDGQRGREFVHGLTNELSTAESTFTPGRGRGLHHLPGAKPDGGVDPLFETWSVGFYNPCGGHVLGQVFPPSGEPQVQKDDKTAHLRARGMPFPEGTVVVKILNTTADESAVPYLKGSTSWQADGHKQLGPSKYATCDREVRKVHIVQMDLAVVDTRSPTRWVYTTLAYDGTLPGKTVLDRMKPIGVQWGSDPKTFPAVADRATKPTETLIAPVGAPEHYGCHGRLAGVVDQPDSSCVSCHMAAFTSPPGVLQQLGTNVPNPFNFDGICTTFNAANTSYFSDYVYPSPYPGGAFDAAIPLDSSLQVAVAFQQYAVFKNPGTPTGCPDPGQPKGGPQPK